MEMLPVILVAFLALHMVPIGRLTLLCLNLPRVLSIMSNQWKYVKVLRKMERLSD